MTRLLLLLSSILWRPIGLAAQPPAPLDLARQVAGRYTHETAFAFRLTAYDAPLDLHVIDLRHSLGCAAEGPGYALSTLVLEAPQVLVLGLACPGPLKVWLNGELVLARTEPEPRPLAEIAPGRLRFPDTLHLRLAAGPHELLLGVWPAGDQWTVCLRPQRADGVPLAGVTFRPPPLAQGLETPWLCLGPVRPGMTLDPTRDRRGLYPEWGLHWTPAAHPGRTVLQRHDERWYPDEGQADWHYTHGLVQYALLGLAQATDEARWTAYVDSCLTFFLAHQAFFAPRYHEGQDLRVPFFRYYRQALPEDGPGAGLGLISRLNLPQPPAGIADLGQALGTFLHAGLPRRGDGTLARAEPSPGAVWIDDLLMSVPAALQLARWTGDAAYRDEAARQVLQMSGYLFDPEKGLYYHGWLPSHRLHNGICWGRANGIAAWSLAEVLADLPERDPRYETLRTYYLALMQNLLRYQAENGAWRQVIDYDGSQAETGATALILTAMCTGIARGWLPPHYEPARDRAWAWLSQTVDAQGRVHGACAETALSERLDDYLRRPRYVGDPRGTGPFLLAALAMTRF